MSQWDYYASPVNRLRLSETPKLPVLSINFQVWNQPKFWSCHTRTTCPRTMPTRSWFHRVWLDQRQCCMNIVTSTVPKGACLAPEELLKLIKCTCHCELPCSAHKCGCRRTGIACTGFCGCHNDGQCLYMNNMRPKTPLFLITEVLKKWPASQGLFLDKHVYVCFVFSGLSVMANNYILRTI